MLKLPNLKEWAYRVKKMGKPRHVNSIRFHSQMAEPDGELRKSRLQTPHFPT